jgi:ABC-type cobalamin/Fe3+-siderophores transport system ATPase subunit
MAMRSHGPFVLSAQRSDKTPQPTRFRRGMYISKFQVSNYKSYRNSGEVEFKPGFNILTGQNSAGKTALLEALTFQFAPRPHVGPATVPTPGIAPDPSTSVAVDLVISGQEMVQLLRTMSGARFQFPRPVNGFRFPSGLVFDGTPDRMNKALGELTQQSELQIRVQLTRSVTTGDSDSWAVKDANFLGIYQIDGAGHQQTQWPFFTVRVSPEATLLVDGGPSDRVTADDVRALLASQLRLRIYRFRAERFNVGQSPFGNNPTMSPNASNLPEVLNVLNANRPRFDELNREAGQILPQVRQVSVRPSGGNNVEILIWAHGKTDRLDLAIPLNECGSGVGQVLAILYVVMTSDHPQVIIVDEPQSFLHPGAVWKLVEVLKRYPRHQYIFATHSPTVITAADPATLIMVRAIDGESSLETMDPDNAKHLQAYLSEIGARLSDVFGADNILWVEGQTEEKCFPLLLRKLANRSLMGTAVVGIRQTGDLQGRDREKVLGTYRKLSEAKTLLPKAIAFVFDEECMAEKQKEDLRKMGPGLVHFLPMRMYENYLLDAEAVANVANGIKDLRERPVSADDVTRLFEAKRDMRDPKDPTGRQLLYFCKGITDVPADWKRHIHAADVLKDVFTELSDAKVSYEKTVHSVAITQLMIEQYPDKLRDLTKWLAGLVWPQERSGA